MTKRNGIKILAICGCLLFSTIAQSVAADVETNANISAALGVITNDYRFGVSAPNITLNITAGGILTASNGVIGVNSAATNVNVIIDSGAVTFAILSRKESCALPVRDGGCSKSLELMSLGTVIIIQSVACCAG